MKELSIEEKAKAYDERLAKARKEYSIHEANNAIGIMDTLERVFPELAESEDEKIRQLLLSFVKYDMDDNYSDDFSKEECVAWLEKQGEQKPILDVEIPFGAKDSELQEVSYHIPEGFHAEIEDNKVVIKKGEHKPDWSEEDEDILNTIINHFKVDIECTDEDDMVRWLKSLKDRVQPQLKQEWSEEDEKMKNAAIMACKYMIDNFENSTKDYEDAINWLKSLKPGT